MRRLKVNVLYGLKSIKNRKLQSLFLIVQITCSILLMCYVVTNYYDSKNVLEHINRYMSGKNIYTFHNLDTYDLLEEKDNQTVLEKYKKVYSIINSSEVEKVLVSNIESFSDEKDREFNTLQISPNFFKKYGITISESNSLTTVTFKLRKGDIYNKKEVPVYVGNDLKKQYKLNEIINTNDKVSFKVVGFLDSGQSVSLPMQGKESLSMDGVILIPFYLDLEENFMSYLESLQFIAQDKEEIADIIKVLNQEKIADYYFKNYKDQLEPIKRDYINLYAIYLSIGMIFAVFSVVSIIGMIIQIIEDSEYEYGVSMMCGARKSDIFMRLITQITSMFVMGVISLYALFGATKASNTIMIALLFVIGILLIYSFKKIKTGEIIKKIKVD